MPLFRYRAKDKTGKEVYGTIQGGSEAEINVLLIKRGYAPIQVIPAEATVKQPAQQPAPTASNNPFVKTKLASEKELFFYFTQLHTLLKTGISPAESMRSVCHRITNQDLRTASMHISESAIRGIPISESMQRFPKLFDPYIVGTIQAGETGGYLPDAVGTLIQFYEDSAALKRNWWMMRLLTWNGLISLAYAIPLFPAIFIAGSAATDSSSALGDVLTRFAFEYLRMCLLIVTPIWLALYLVFWAIRRKLSDLPHRRFRHQFVLKMPFGFSQRAMAESLGLFAYHLDKLHSAAIAPGAAWRLAASAVPNQAVSDKLLEICPLMGTDKDFSYGFMNTPLFPAEMKGLIISAAQTGNYNSALENMTRYFRMEKEAMTQKSRYWSGSIGCSITLLLSGITIAILLYMLYKGMFSYVDEFFGH